MKILLLGKNGQVGLALNQSLQVLGRVIALGRNEADLANLDLLSQVLATHQPDIIVNAAAYTAVDRAETDERLAYTVNAEAVDIMANYAKRHGVLLIHYSTDYVFDGSKSDAYIETDLTAPLSVYGCSKRAGEEAILASQCDSFIFRTSWVVSAQGRNFIKTMLRLAQNVETLNVVADQFGVPTSATLLAEVTVLAIQSYCVTTHSHPSTSHGLSAGSSHVTGLLDPADKPRDISVAQGGKLLPSLLETGIYHLAPNGKTTWHELATYVIQRASKNGMILKLKPSNIQAIPTEAYPLPAVRPKNSCLNTKKLTDALGLNLPTWQQHIDNIVDELTVLENVV